MQNQLTSDKEIVTDAPAPGIAPEGMPIVLGFLLVEMVLIGLGLWVGWTYLPQSLLHGAWLGIVVAMVTTPLSVWCVWFFRDPPRRVPVRVGGKPAMVSPADGVVCFVGGGAEALPPGELGLDAQHTRGMTRVSVFMNVFNVHVNRAPIAGKVVAKSYRPGAFFNASFNKASELNERMSLVLEDHAGRRIVCVQIAGLIARRIVCRVNEGRELATGERYGLIRFGSRVDVYLPEGVTPLVKVGDKTVAGETVLALVGERAGR